MELTPSYSDIPVKQWYPSWSVSLSSWCKITPIDSTLSTQHKLKNPDLIKGQGFLMLKIGLRNESANIGQGVHINGLNLLNEYGLVKTEAHCKTLGGWIKFRNVNGGRTQILDSYGVWTFS